MDTKSKRFFRSSVLKFIVFILIALMIASVAGVSVYTISTGQIESLVVDNYLNAETGFQHDVLSHLNYLQTDTELYVEPEKPNGAFYYSLVSGKAINNTDDTKMYENAPSDSIYFAFENGKLITSNNFPKDSESTLKNIEAGWSSHLADQFVLYPKSYIEAEQSEWNSMREKTRALAILVITAIVLAFIGIVFLTFQTGKKPEDEEIHLNFFDSWFLELLIIAVILTIGLMIASTAHFISLGGFSYYSFDGKMVLTSLVFFVTFAATSVVGVCYLSIVRRLKANMFWKSSFTYFLLSKIYGVFTDFADIATKDRLNYTESLKERRDKFVKKSAILAVLFMGLLLFNFPTIFLLVPVIGEAFLIYQLLKGDNKTYAIINEGVDENLEEKMKAERTKINLITNVSHDLKTPLTSIISYIDLLKKEELNETARDYVNVISDKANRLSNIVSDLFNLAKSTSGNIDLELENLDLKKLIEQTIVDMDDKIEASNNIIKLTLTEGPAYIYSDGKKLYRVFQNLIDNALKYSLDGTRIFVSLEEKNGSYISSVINTSSYPMDFTADEIRERFYRGDKSRSTEGSGLGLSIAESFTLVTGGKFDLDLSGDQFVARVIYNKAQDI